MFFKLSSAFICNPHNLMFKLILSVFWLLVFFLWKKNIVKGK
jgi:hypothetical protein